MVDKHYSGYVLASAGEAFLHLRHPDDSEPQLCRAGATASISEFQNLEAVCRGDARIGAEVRRQLDPILDVWLSIVLDLDAELRPRPDSRGAQDVI